MIRTHYFITKRAFTLIEILLYLSLFMIVVGGTVAFIQKMLETNTKINLRSQANNEAEHALNLITHYIRNARSVTVPSLQNSGDTLTLVVSDTPHSPATFNLVNNTIMLSEGGNAALPLTSGHTSISNLTFTNIGTASHSSIHVSFTLQTRGETTKQEYTYEKTYEIGRAHV